MMILTHDFGILCTHYFLVYTVHIYIGCTQKCIDQNYTVKRKLKKNVILNKTPFT